MADVAAALKKVLESIRSLEKPLAGEKAAQIPEESSPDVDMLLKQLAEAIDRADPEEIMQLMSAFRQQAAQCDHIDPLSLKNLEDQVNRYDYDRAMETIRQMSRK